MAGSITEQYITLLQVCSIYVTINIKYLIEQTSMQLSDIPIFVTFATIVEVGSITGAAKKLGCSKAAVSRYLSRLEYLAETKLLNRTTRSITLTSTGQELYKKTVNLVGNVQELDQLVSSLSEKPTGILHVTAPPIFVSSNVMGLIPAFLLEHPEVQIDLTLTNKLPDPTLDSFDVALRASDVIDDSLATEPIARYEMTICGSPAYFEKFGVPRIPQDLQRHQCVLQTETPESDVWHLLDQDIRVVGRLRTNTAQVIRRALLRGFGLGYIARFGVNDDILAGRLVSVLENFMPASRSIYLTYPRADRIPVKTRAFVRFIRQSIEEHGLSWSPY